MASVLVVDDRGVNREFLTTLLDHFGLQVLEAGDGVEGLEVARRHHPDLVITDILMPSMDGFEFVSRLRDDSDRTVSAVPIVFYTATFRLFEAREMARRCGVERVLSKPSEPQEILDAVAAVLGTSSAALDLLAPVDDEPPGSLGDPLPRSARGLVQLERRLGRGATASTAVAVAEPEREVERPRREAAIARAARSLPADGAYGLSLRIAALLELSLVLAQERDPQRLVEIAGRAARNVLNARYSVVLLGLGPGWPRRCAVHGMSAADAGRVEEELDPRAGEFGRMLADGRPRRLHEIGDRAAGLGLPAGHPPIRDLLAVPVATGSRVNGWLYVADKLGEETFSESDEQLAETLAAQLAPTYESLTLLGEVEHHADQLEREIAEREQQQRRVARLSRLYSVRSSINAAIIRIQDRQLLLEEACRIAVGGGTYEAAWIAAVVPETLETTVVARAGGEADCLEEVDLTAEPESPERTVHPVFRAVREERAVICNDLGSEPALAGLGADLIGRGYHALAVLPLFVDARVVAVLGLLGGEPELFDEEEMTLLTELAGDISFGLQYIEKTERLDYLAYYDGLTGLANRNLFEDRLDRFLERGETDDGIMAVFEIDIDRFTQLNDTLGRHVGDALLRGVAERLERALEEGSLVARLGADSFAVAVAGLRHEADASTVLEERVFPTAFDQPLVVGEREIRLTARAGIALYPGDGEDAETLIRNAEAARKRAQQSGRRTLFYAPEISVRAAERLALEDRLREALERQQFVLYYQPRLDAASGRQVGLEALIRWRHPEDGIVEPGRFVPVLEETGMISDVDRWVLIEALSQRRRWQDAGLEPPRVSVNVSMVGLHQGDLADVVETAIRTAHAAPRDLELEVTESAIMEDFAANRSALRRLQEMGVSIGIDDFGTGYSSLRYLAQLPADALKIDRSFVDCMTSDADGMAIVSAVISLARSLRLRVVAEGVESAEQAKLLRLMKCDELQGFFFCKPKPAEEIESILSSRKTFELP